MRLTKIICTLGPASLTPEGVLSLAKNGMNIARINFSHGSAEQHVNAIRLVRSCSETHGIAIATLLDTKGPEIRTGDTEAPIPIHKGQEVIFTHGALEDPTRTIIHVNYDAFPRDAAHAKKIILDNGTMLFDVIAVEDDRVIARALDDGMITSRRHVNVPGASISLPTMTEKDWEDVRLGIRENMDFIAVSFVRTAKDIEEITAFIQQQNHHMRVIAKIETREAVDNIDAIIAASDGVMVARGDLGAELPYEQIPAIQDSIVEKCRRAGKPVIVATHMLESMIEHPLPTRAEVTDIAHAATTRADMTMLSGETAAGAYPAQSVQVMHTVLQETESRLPPDIHFVTDQPFGERHALAKAAASMALSMRAPAIVVLTRTGKTAQCLSMLRPGIPIIALTQSPETQRALQLHHGVLAYIFAEDADPEKTVEQALAIAKEKHDAKTGDRIVIIGEVKTQSGTAHAVHVRTVS